MNEAQYSDIYDHRISPVAYLFLIAIAKAFLNSIYIQLSFKKKRAQYSDICDHKISPVAYLFLIAIEKDNNLDPCTK